MSHQNTTFDQRLLDSFPPLVRPIVRFVVEWLPLVIVAGLWEYVSGTVVPRSVLPPMTDVAGTAVTLLTTGEIIPHLTISLVRVALGLGASIVVGVLLGVGMAQSDRVENFFDIFLTLLYPIPKTALVPLALLWLGVGTEAAILIVFLACLLPIVLNSYNAAQDVDQNLIRSAQMMGTDGWRVTWKVLIPETIPEILTGIRQAIPFAFIALVSAEFIAANSGVGSQILAYGQIGNYRPMFAVIVIISITAYVAVRGFEGLKERFVVWI
ncbi:ABC transporter permease [Halococcus hamelinensis]|uniref:Binding-protein-dependent transporters inner membrane component n=1 Tax=Halococcus hamelinensis 100A6 TaxID=1132509 RepID=M0LY25_9EURY|nr:ABC transporter permease [Halococcus hamelinensis]EMA37264.1 binding-protein-dependent transporters inner membrane component [Halococcus hamelinensis 100A6]